MEPVVAKCSFCRQFLESYDSVVSFYDICIFTGAMLHYRLNAIFYFHRDISTSTEYSCNLNS